MSDGEALLRGILERPADDTARLVYADWLQENGRAVHAQLIRNTFGESSRGGPRRVWVSNNNHCLRGYRNEDKWFVVTSRTCPQGTVEWVRSSLPKPTAEREHSAVIRTGFVCTLSCPLAYFMQHAEALFRAHPIERVALTDRIAVGELDGEPSQRWYRDHTHNQNRVRDFKFYLPPEIFDSLTRGDLHDSAVPFSRNYLNTPDRLPHADISRACVAYGRERAGLSKIAIPA